MSVSINGKRVDHLEGKTLLQMLDVLKLTAGPVAIEVNKKIVTRAKHAEYILKEGDEVEVVHFVGGG